MKIEKWFNFSDIHLFKMSGKKTQGGEGLKIRKTEGWRGKTHRFTKHTAVLGGKLTEELENNNNNKKEPKK